MPARPDVHKVIEQQGKQDRRIGASPWVLQDGDRLRSRQAGCDGHLVKPVQLADLVALLRRVGNPS